MEFFFTEVACTFVKKRLDDRCYLACFKKFHQTVSLQKAPVNGCFRTNAEIAEAAFCRCSTKKVSIL